MIATAPANVPMLSAPTDEPAAGNYFVAAYPPFSAWNSAQVPALHEALAQPAPAAPLGLYVHLPFCQKKCDYCYYLSCACKLSAHDQLVREFILQLKLGEVPIAPFRQRFGVDLANEFAGPRRACAAEGWLTVSGEAMRLTRQGLLRVDRLLPRFYDSRFQGVRYS